eukprot:1500554-Pleurochrysis_carterae.AAC.1
MMKAIVLRGSARGVEGLLVALRHAHESGSSGPRAGRYGALRLAQISGGGGSCAVPSQLVCSQTTANKRQDSRVS